MMPRAGHGIVPMGHVPVSLCGAVAVRGDTRKMNNFISYNNICNITISLSQFLSLFWLVGGTDLRMLS